MNAFLRSKKCDAAVRYNTVFRKSVLLRYLPVASPSWLHFGFHGRVSAGHFFSQKCVSTYLPVASPSRLQFGFHGRVPGRPKYAFTVNCGHSPLSVTSRISRSRLCGPPLFTKACLYGTFRSLAPLGYTSDFTVASLRAGIAFSRKGFQFSALRT